MTQTDELTGRALNEALARALGWRKLAHGDHDWQRPNGKMDMLPDWQGDIAAAWQLIEGLKESAVLFPEVYFHVTSPNRYHYRCRVWLNNGNTHGWIADEYADTAPLAIARAAYAALAALGGDDA